MEYNEQNFFKWVNDIFGVHKVKTEIIIDTSFFDDLNSLVLQNQFSTKNNDIIDFFDKFVPIKLEVISFYKKKQNKINVMEIHHILFAAHNGIVYKFDFYFEYKNSFAIMRISTKKNIGYSFFPFYKRVRLTEARQLYPNGCLSIFDYLHKQFGIFDRRFKQ